ncbi:hypothetical protein AVEN_42899-1 [Araneus ventricosus]|uniref:Uncharacterized protein n=1 Tax=Araneus ventricosus TaxID=182803 RepID=A0A4Y2AF74_ARAVE|nr:hypothetical protein AVEN_42899-1 [Araneus ventricosus]
MISSKFYSLTFYATPMSKHFTSFEGCPLRGTSSSGVTRFTTPRYPSDLISLQALPFPSASTFRFSASFLRTASEGALHEILSPLCLLLFLVDSQKPHVLAVRGDPLDG